MGRRPRQRALSLQNLRPERQRVDAPRPFHLEALKPCPRPCPRRDCWTGRASLLLRWAGHASAPPSPAPPPAQRPAQRRPPPSAPPRPAPPPAQRSAPPRPAPRQPAVRLCEWLICLKLCPPPPPPVRILSPLLSLSLSGFSVIVSCSNVCLPCWISCLVRKC